MNAAPLCPLLVVSPHCDDAVFACGAFIAASPGSRVVTIFAGSPCSYDPMTEWDRAAGFVPGDDVMHFRREEDRRALQHLDAVPHWLEFLDTQYGRSPRVEEVESALAAILYAHRPRTIAFPLGLYHSDHVIAHRAALRLVLRYPQARWLLYEDALYRCIPGAVTRQTNAVENGGYALREVDVATSEQATHRKREAIDCYGSQLKALATSGRPGHRDAIAPERYLEIVRIPVPAA